MWSCRCRIHDHVSISLSPSLARSALGIGVWHLTCFNELLYVHMNCTLTPCQCRRICVPFRRTAETTLVIQCNGAVSTRRDGGKGKGPVFRGSYNPRCLYGAGMSARGCVIMNYGLWCVWITHYKMCNPWSNRTTFKPRLGSNVSAYFSK